MAESNDFSTDYLAHRERLAASSGADEMIEWLARQRKPGGTGTPATPHEYKPIPEPEGKPLEPFPTARPVPPDPSMLGTVTRGAGEIPKQVFGGIEDAV